MAGRIFEGYVVDGINGGRRGLWKETSTLVERFIAREKLDGYRLRLYQARTPIKLPPRFPGIPAPHLHQGGKVYPLNQEQWGRFTTAVIRDLRVRMNNIENVDLDKLSALSAVINK